MRGEEAMFTKEMSGHLEPFNYHGSINLDVTDVPSYSDHSYTRHDQLKEFQKPYLCNLLVESKLSYLT